MDSLITAAARALAAGDPLAALKRVALRDDAAALALRGIAMAQLGDLPRARALLRRARHDFGVRETLARARCLLAEAEIALVSRELSWPAQALATARATLEHHGDRLNAAHARHLEVRLLLLLGHIDDADRLLAELDPTAFPPASRAAHELVVAGIAIRRLQTQAARTALARAGRAAQAAAVPALVAEIANATRLLRAPAGRLIRAGTQTMLRLDEVEALFSSNTVVIDACRYMVRDASCAIRLVRRPVLFALARALGEAWPDDVPRDTLVARAFRARRADESHRVRLRVEIGRLRALLVDIAQIIATPRGFALRTQHSSDVAVLATPIEEKHGTVLAFLSDGESWSTSALSLAMGTSQRTVQRALESLAVAGKVQAIGRARARRWMSTPIAGFTTTLLLPAPLPSD